MIAGERQNADELGRHLDREKDQNEPDRRNDRARFDQRSRLEEIEWGQDRECDDAHAVRQFAFGEKCRGERHTHEVGGQDRLAPRHRRHSAERQQNEGNEFRLRLAHPLPEAFEHPRRIARKDNQHDGGDGSKQEQPKVIAGKHDAEREHGAEIVDEAGGKNDLADLGVVEPGFDHHRVDDRNRGRRQRDSGDLRLRPRPADDEMGVKQHPEVRRDETDDADRHARPEVFPDDARIDFRAGEEGQ